MVWGQRKLRQAVGTVKDQTKIGLTRVSWRNRTRDLEIAIVRSTSHDLDVPPAEDTKRANEVVQAIIGAGPDSVPVAAVALTRRLERTRNWVVALKCVRLVHRLARADNGRLQCDVVLARAAGIIRFDFSRFRCASKSDEELFAFAHGYAAFLGEALDAAAETAAQLFDESEDKVLLALIERSGRSQRLLDCAVACLPFGAARRAPLVRMALEPVVRESFRLYADVCDCMATLVDGFLEMEHSLCMAALEVYKKAALQSDQLACFYKSCCSMGVCAPSEYPTVEQISQANVDAWEDFVSDRTQNRQHSRVETLSATSSPSSSFSATPQQCQLFEANDRPSPIQAQDKFLAFLNEADYKCSPFPNEMQEKCSESFQNVAQDIYRPFADDVRCTFQAGKFNGNSIEFENVREWADKFAIVPSSKGLETRISNVWEDFDDSKEEDKSSSWEHALDMCVASISASSEDPFVASVGIASGSASSEDPFAASMGIAPPSYVQMEDTARMYAFMLQQQFWQQQYENIARHGHYGYEYLQGRQYSNPFAVQGVRNMPFAGTHAFHIYNTGGIA